MDNDKATNKYTSQLTKEDIKQFVHKCVLRPSKIRSVKISATYCKKYWEVWLDENDWSFLLLLFDYDITTDGPNDAHDVLLKRWQNFLGRKFKTYKKDLKNHRNTQFEGTITDLNS